MLNCRKMLVEVNNVTNGEEPYVVARFAEDGKLWYYGRYPSRKQANDIAELTDGLVLEDVPESEEEVKARRDKEFTEELEDFKKGVIDNV